MNCPSKLLSVCPILYHYFEASLLVTCQKVLKQKTKWRLHKLQICTATLIQNSICMLLLFLFYVSAIDFWGPSKSTSILVSTNSTFVWFACISHISVGIGEIFFWLFKDHP